ncbi:hypothetical protein HNQ51_000367 [Inhella inkyongensis]|uniref:DUF3667 domain-containing protein n=1 Tax=Inhella inkyongensis TaxID=392593 RepID=A0A840S2K2_9BURK|nr:DUF3667 domain-containing protein [Inhella inkyongensis]MBB5203074.1 hypothetical protein [Inhella inkyongensis]
MTTASPQCPNACPNCGHRLAAWDKFCAQCGQAAHLHQPSFWEFVHEFINHYVALEGKLWHSLRLLLLRPGQLTLDYLQGRRARHVMPLHLLLSFGLLCLVSIKLRPASPHVEPGSGWANLGILPYAVVLALPVLAGVMQRLYSRRSCRYGEHMVFVVHQQALVYLLVTLGIWIERAGLEWLEPVPLLMIALAPLLALQRVYGGRWWATLLRFLIYQASYLLIGFCFVLMPLAFLPR